MGKNPERKSKRGGEPLMRRPRQVTAERIKLTIWFLVRAEKKMANGQHHSRG